MKRTISVNQIVTIRGVTVGRISAVSISAILKGKGVPACPVVVPWLNLFVVTFGVNHFIAEKLRGKEVIEVEVQPFPVGFDAFIDGGFYG